MMASCFLKQLMMHSKATNGYAARRAAHPSAGQQLLFPRLVVGHQVGLARRRRLRRSDGRAPGLLGKLTQFPLFGSQCLRGGTMAVML